MCPKHKGQMHDTAMGECTKCHGTTTSMAFKLCTRCAISRNVCQVCEKPL